MAGLKHFEDFIEGPLIEYQVPGLTSEEIRGFAALYDPQRFHLDGEEAANTHFGGLVASGFQTQLLCFKPFCEQILAGSWCVGSPGIETVKWHRPWYPNEALQVSVALAAKRLSASRKDRGYLDLKLRASCNGAPTLSMDWTVIVLTTDFC